MHMQGITLITDNVTEIIVSTSGNITDLIGKDGEILNQELVTYSFRSPEFYSAVGWGMAIFGVIIILCTAIWWYRVRKAKKNI